MPALSQIHIDQALTNLSVMYRNANYVADQVIPVVPVNKRSNKYFVYRREDYLSSSSLDANNRPMSLRQPGAEAAEIDMQLSNAELLRGRVRVSRPRYGCGSGDCRQPAPAGYGPDRAADRAPPDR